MSFFKDDTTLINYSAPIINNPESLYNFPEFSYTYNIPKYYNIYEFIKNKNIKLSNEYIFFKLFNYIKENNGVIINEEILEFVGFYHNFSKERNYIDILKEKNIKYKKIDCNNKKIKKYINNEECSINNQNYLNLKTWIFLNLIQFRKMLFMINNDQSKLILENYFKIKEISMFYNEYIEYYNSIINKYNNFLDKYFKKKIFKKINLFKTNRRNCKKRYTYSIKF